MGVGERDINFSCWVYAFCVNTTRSAHLFESSVERLQRHEPSLGGGRRTIQVGFGKSGLPSSWTRRRFTFCNRNI